MLTITHTRTRIVLPSESFDSVTRESVAVWRQKLRDCATTFQLMEMNLATYSSKRDKNPSTNGFMIVESVAKYGDKNSAIKRRINYILDKLPFPHERIDHTLAFVIDGYHIAQNPNAHAANRTRGICLGRHD